MNGTTWKMPAGYARQCIELSRLWGNYTPLARGLLVTGRLELARGNPEKAREAMHAVEQLIVEQSFAPWRSATLACALARLWIAQGDFGRAAALVEKAGLTVAEGDAGSEVSYLQEPRYLILLRLHLTRGETGAALALSERLLHQLEKTGRLGRLIEVLVLRALAFQGIKDQEQACSVMDRALSLAQSEGYIRAFLDEGEPAAKLLYQVRSQRPGASFAAECLSAMGDSRGQHLPPSELLIEPLTLREIEVLKLIEAGCSNQDIASRLFISMPTVKRHISNIYAKLGASSRTQAVSRARELKLFE